MAHGSSSEPQESWSSEGVCCSEAGSHSCLQRGTLCRDRQVRGLPGASVT